MSSSTDILVPHETVNDDFVTIVQWHAEPGQKIEAGHLIVSIETSKTVLDVEAEADGYVEMIHALGAEVAVGELIGRIHENSDAAVRSSAAPGGDVSQGATADSSQQAAPSESPADVSISRKAQVMIDQYGIDPNVFVGCGLVREAQVIEYLQKQEQSQPQDVLEAPSTAAESGTSESTATAESPLPPARKRGLIGDAQVSAGDRGKSVVWIALNYLFRNWLLGNLVRWAPRGVILPLHRLRGVKMGHDCFIDPTAIVETAYPEKITLGNDVRITAGVIVMAHIKAPHYLRDMGIMPPVVKPVILEDHCFIGVNAVVMPGVTVGRASVVASGAVAMNNVPPFTLVAGNPAKVIKRFPRPSTNT